MRQGGGGVALGAATKMRRPSLLNNARQFWAFATSFERHFKRFPSVWGGRGHENFPGMKAEWPPSPSLMLRPHGPPTKATGMLCRAPCSKSTTIGGPIETLTAARLELVLHTETAEMVFSMGSSAVRRPVRTSH